ncbi:enoyl-CoA hydratase/isomerase family protein [Mycolicibacterium flavescens]|uniref:Enoyl-CoA hydratase n=1 Tax=Mycolicibacterium flavescens TaxID=1776 RepID=A0A1E3RDJ0_MYCFV|nr:enoyl-CoA hydratase-related protein [Mycolicibacterium flavescens]MCV7282415.1 enoyl-CoA hydratase/isomerase family protein [Mycolicibacterium flavescens]ODQ87935.1 enoyl-CoA hydratase [Mycolicibacterium flavescens]
MADGITVEQNGATALVWLDRPDRGNAFITAMQIELHRQLERLDADEAVRAIVVTGRGRHFSTGADMEPGGSNFAFDDEQHRRSRAELAARPRPWRLRTPVIGALNGSAVGIGLTFPLQWDIRIVNESAKYGFVFTRRGLIPEQNSLWLLPRLVGFGRAMDLMLTGRLFSGADAAEYGLAIEALPGDDVLPRALQIADEIAANTSAAAVGVTKQFAYELLGETDREAAFYREWEAFRWFGRQSDATEGVASFLDRRAPNFTLPKHVSLPQPDRGWSPDE